jgi:16S rRNA (cytosine1402-N4)-methyltransferase
VPAAIFSTIRTAARAPAVAAGGAPVAARRAPRGRRARSRGDSRLSAHRPVLLAEAISALRIRRDGIYVDGTFGRGGHSAAILDALQGTGTLHALDRDPEARAHGRQAFAGKPNFRLHAGNFGDLGPFAAAQGIFGRVDGILLDLGVSSPQLDNPARGFAFAADGPLDMRMDPDSGESAALWLNRADEQEIADVLWRYGEERNSRRIARRIVGSRAAEPLRGTAQLAALIAAVPGPRSRTIHPATRSFQAIRIHVNGELAALESALAAAPGVLAAGGRLAVISFHSLEDRIVKRFVRDAEGGRDADEPRMALRGPPPAPRPAVLKRVGRVFPGDAEIAANPRARSAVLRVAERLP